MAIEPHKINLKKRQTKDDKPQTTKSNLPVVVYIKSFS